MGGQVVCISEYTYIKGFQEMDACGDFNWVAEESFLSTNKPKAYDIVKEMRKGYMELLTNQIN